MKIVRRRSVNGQLVEYSNDSSSDAPASLDSHGNSSRLGDKIARVATPIARALRFSCIDPATRELRPESGCAKMKRRLNEGDKIAEALKHRLRGT